MPYDRGKKDSMLLGAEVSMRNSQLTIELILNKASLTASHENSVYGGQRREQFCVLNMQQSKENLP